MSKNLLEVVGRNLRADDFAILNRIPQSFNKFFLVCLDIETHKMGSDVLRNDI